MCLLTLPVVSVARPTSLPRVVCQQSTVHNDTTWCQTLQHIFASRTIPYSVSIGFEPDPTNKNMTTNLRRRHRHHHVLATQVPVGSFSVCPIQWIFMKCYGCEVFVEPILPSMSIVGRSVLTFAGRNVIPYLFIGERIF
jgi:hypothetical protein